MSSTFPRTDRERGYDIDEVEAFLERARVAFSAPAGAPVALTAAEVRRTAFSLRRDGYATHEVDAALERLEDVFAERERDARRAELGEEAWRAELQERVHEVIARLQRPPKRRFARVSVLSDGYDCKQVDEFADRILAYFTEGRRLSVTEVRTVAFRPRRRGYREAQVDLLLDAVIDLMLSVRP